MPAALSDILLGDPTQTPVFGWNLIGLLLGGQATTPNATLSVVGSTTGVSTASGTVSDVGLVFFLYAGLAAPADILLADPTQPESVTWNVAAAEPGTAGTPYATLSVVGQLAGNATASGSLQCTISAQANTAATTSATLSIVGGLTVGGTTTSSATLSGQGDVLATQVAGLAAQSPLVITLATGAVNPADILLADPTQQNAVSTTPYATLSIIGSTAGTSNASLGETLSLIGSAAGTANVLAAYLQCNVGATAAGTSTTPLATLSLVGITAGSVTIPSALLVAPVNLWLYAGLAAPADLLLIDPTVLAALILNIQAQTAGVSTTPLPTLSLVGITAGSATTPGAYLQNTISAQANTAATTSATLSVIGALTGVGGTTTTSGLLSLIGATSVGVSTTPLATLSLVAQTAGSAVSSLAETLSLVGSTLVGTSSTPGATLSLIGATDNSFPSALTPVNLLLYPGASSPTDILLSSTPVNLATTLRAALAGLGNISGSASGSATASGNLNAPVLLTLYVGLAAPTDILLGDPTQLAALILNMTSRATDQATCLAALLGSGDLRGTAAGNSSGTRQFPGWGSGPNASTLSISRPQASIAELTPNKDGLNVQANAPTPSIQVK